MSAKTFIFASIDNLFLCDQKSNTTIHPIQYPFKSKHSIDAEKFLDSLALALESIAYKIPSSAEIIFLPPVNFFHFCFLDAPTVKKSKQDEINKIHLDHTLPFSEGFQTHTFSTSANLTNTTLAVSAISKQFIENIAHALHRFLPSNSCQIHSPLPYLYNHFTHDTPAHPFACILSDDTFSLIFTHAQDILPCIRRLQAGDQASVEKTLRSFAHLQHVPKYKELTTISLSDFPFHNLNKLTSSNLDLTPASIQNTYHNKKTFPYKAASLILLTATALTLNFFYYNENKIKTHTLEFHQAQLTSLTSKQIQLQDLLEKIQLNTNKYKSLESFNSGSVPWTGLLNEIQEKLPQALSFAWIDSLDFDPPYLTLIGQFPTADITPDFNFNPSIIDKVISFHTEPTRAPLTKFTLVLSIQL